jgi:hypothetical protein
LEADLAVSRLPLGGVDSSKRFAPRLRKGGEFPRLLERD